MRTDRSFTHGLSGSHAGANANAYETSTTPDNAPVELLGRVGPIRATRKSQNSFGFKESFLLFFCKSLELQYRLSDSVSGVSNNDEVALLRPNREIEVIMEREPLLFRKQQRAAGGVVRATPHK